MQLSIQELVQFRPEIDALYRQYLGEPFNGGTVFAELTDGVLHGVASVRCYHGHWIFRGCVVKPEYRGQGLQRKLMREAIEHLKEKTEIVRGSIEPWNTHSITNTLAVGFEYEKNRVLPDGRPVQVYVCRLR